MKYQFINIIFTLSKVNTARNSNYMNITYIMYIHKVHFKNGKSIYHLLKVIVDR